MNSMSHVTDCDFEGAKTLELSAKTADFGRLLQFFGENTKKNSQKIGRGCLFSFYEFYKFVRYWPNTQKPNTNLMKC